MAIAFRALLQSLVVLTMVFGACILAAELLYGPAPEQTAQISVAGR